MDRKDWVAGFFGLSVAASLGLAALLLAGLLLGCLWGCSSRVGAPSWADRQIRPAADTARLVQNAAYLKRTGRLALALKELEEAHLRDPNNLEILDLLIQTYEDLGEFDRADELYQKALTQSGQNPALENNRCFSLYLRGRLEEAEGCFRKILSSQPDNHKARNNLGLTLCRQGREAEALAMWREALSDVEARGRLGQALAALGKEVPPSLDVALPQPAAPQPAPPRAAAPPATKEPGVTLGSPVEPGKSEKVGKSVAAASRPAKGSVPRPSFARTEATPEPPAAPPPAAAEPTPAPARVVSPPAAPDPGAALTSSFQPGKSEELKKPVKSEPAPSPERPAPAVAASQDDNAKPAAAVSSSRPEKTQAGSPLPKLTAQDLHTTRIELKNGNGVGNQAKETRSLLNLEGFTVSAVGNHIDFGLEETTIAFRPEAAKVAQALARKFFPEARLKPGGKVSSTADIRISLGRDLMAGQHLSPRLKETTMATEAAPPAAAKRAPAAPVPSAADPPLATPSMVQGPGSSTVLELSQAGIELRNGNGVQGQAREVRTRLSLEGFKVVSIGNHIDFGLDRTIITFRPEAAQVAESLSKKFFPGAILEVNENKRLGPQAAVRVSLGRDLIPDLERLAQAAP